MDANARRREIWRIIEQEAQLVSASLLAKRLGVSRQVIVGDIALLRAQGYAITATARGYTVMGTANARRYVGKLACLHSAAQTREELYTMVDMGAEVLDVMVEHDLYGEISGQLGLSCRRDVDNFIQRVSQGESRLLSELTGGAHVHTLSCPDEAVFHHIKEALQKQGLLYPEQ